MENNVQNVRLTLLNIHLFKSYVMHLVKMDKKEIQNHINAFDILEITDSFIKLFFKVMCLIN